MIQICKLHKVIISSFKNYDELFKYINNLEYRRLFEESDNSSRENWNFTIYPHQRLSYIYYKAREKFSTEIEKEAYERELDLIGIYRGDYKNPIQIPVTPDINIETIKKNWCREYCFANQFYLIEE